MVPCFRGFVLRSRRRCCAPGAIALLCWLAGSLLVHANEPPGDVPTPSRRLLVLRNGRVVRGQINVVAGGYMVDKPNGSMLVPFDQIRLEAKSLQDAHRLLHATMPIRTANKHIELAQWCMTYQLYDEAKQELREALLLEPQRKDARTMLRRLEEVLNPEARFELPPPEEPALTVDGFEASEVESLSGLSPEAAEEFTGRIQPILLNKCGNASCHGPRVRSNGFRLHHVRLGQGGHRILTERNLAAVLNFINLERPETSPLLILPSEQHDFSGRAVFHGRQGAGQLDALRNWVRQIAERPTAPDLELVLDPSLENRNSRPAPPPSRPRNQAPDFSKPENITVIRGYTPPPQPPSTISIDDAIQADDSIRELLRDRAKDAFDPDVFNRTYH